MLVREDGQFEGAVSGGCVEADVLQTGADIIAGQPARLKTYGVADAKAWEFGLPCGGEIKVLVQAVSEAGFPPELFDRLSEARQRGESIAISTDPASRSEEHTSELQALMRI